MIRTTEENKQLIVEKEAEVQEARVVLYSKLEIIGNLVHDSVPVSNDEVCMKFCFPTSIYENLGPISFAN